MTLADFLPRALVEYLSLDGKTWLRARVVRHHPHPFFPVTTVQTDGAIYSPSSARPARRIAFTRSAS